MRRRYIQSEKVIPKKIKGDAQNVSFLCFIDRFWAAHSFPHDKCRSWHSRRKILRTSHKSNRPCPACGCGSHVQRSRQKAPRSRLRSANSSMSYYRLLFGIFVLEQDHGRSRFGRRPLEEGSDLSRNRNKVLLSRHFIWIFAEDQVAEGGKYGKSRYRPHAERARKQQADLVNDQ